MSRRQCIIATVVLMVVIIVLSMLACRYLDNDPAAQKLFQGDYMYQYSWAEETGSKLTMNL